MRPPHELTLVTLGRWPLIVAALLTATALLLPPTVTASATAQGTTYVGLNVGRVVLEVDDNAGDSSAVRPTAAGLHAGYFPWRQVAIEGRIGLGVKDVEERGEHGKSTLELEHLIGLYAVGHLLDYRDLFSLYLLAGVTKAQWSNKPPSPSSRMQMSDTAPTIGIGATFYPHPGFGYQIEYIRYHSGGEDRFRANGQTGDKLEWDLSAVNVGVIRLF
ncbi:hypothetical protein CKO15_10990 [Halorhodospira abdelmalekii]|uniref:outer membrane beta-barrel protein n=1 Tax=Halorhodospira abdelmalekii TaxID=421629 RepID=UPI0019062976|nr:outer membrane beta-barrel protein [Halorhodospira abdelmalekii]MBK1735793.1 hypothetical protein [Halorhodospira abdelmalekii]